MPLSAGDRARLHRIRVADRLRDADAAVRRRDTFVVSAGVLVAVLAAEMSRIGDLPRGPELVRSLPSLYKDECQFRRSLGLEHDNSVAERIGRQLTAPQSPDVTACTIVDSLFGPTHAARLRVLFDQRGWPEDRLGATSTPPRTARSSPAAPNRRSKTPRGLASIGSGMVMVGVPTPAKDRAKASRDREKAQLRVGADAQRDLDRWSLSLAALAGVGLFCVPTGHLQPLAGREDILRRRLCLRGPGLLSRVITQHCPWQDAIADAIVFVQQVLGSVAAERVNGLAEARRFPPPPPGQT